MDTKQRIAAILKQKNYQVSKGKVLRYDRMEDKYLPVPCDGNRIPLIKTDSVVEIFIWDEVKKVIEGMSNGKPPEAVVDDLPIKLSVSADDSTHISTDGSNVMVRVTDPNEYTPKKFKPSKHIKRIAEMSPFKDVIMADSIALGQPAKADPKASLVLKSKSNKMTKEKKLKVAKKALKKVEKKVAPNKKAPVKKTKNPDRSQLSDAQKSEIKKEASNLKNGMSITQLANKFGVLPHTVGHHYRKIRTMKPVLK